MRHDIDITDARIYGDGVPHDAFRWLRANAPVSFHPEKDGVGHWALVRHEDVVRAGRDWRRFSSGKGSTLEEMTEAELEARRSILDLDPPAHTRIKRLIGPGFTPRVVVSYEAAFRAMTRELLVTAMKGEFDFVEAIAKPVTVSWLLEHLGVPLDMADQIVEWTDRMLMGSSDPELHEERDDTRYRMAPFGSKAGLECFEYAAALAAERRANPGDDVISQVLAAEPGGEPLTDTEFKNFFAVLMIAGQEASRHTIGQGTLALLENPDQRTLLQDNPDLMDSAVEEILRWSTPIYHFRRTATEEIELYGQTIPPGAKVTLWYISANFDESVFDEPQRFDIERNPNDHVAFGKGPHHCLGANLGRLQVKVTIEELLPYFDRLSMTGAPQRLQSNFIHGLKTMPVRVS